jgi:hypothetical protein
MCSQIGHDVAAHDAPIGHAKRARRLHIVQFAQFERLGAQQPRQRVPTRHTQNHGQQEQPHIGALQPGLKQIGFLSMNT